MKVLFDIGIDLPGSEKEKISQAWPGAEVIFHLRDGNKPITGMETIDILAAEFPPQDPRQWKALQFFQCVAAGINHFNKHPIWDTEIPVATASGIHSVPMAEFA